jgi:putative transcriptional regulator
VATESLAGKLLVATPLLNEPTFLRTVILVCAHDDQSSLGLILNRPVRSESVLEHLPIWSSVASAPSVLFEGGPVEPAVALSLGQAKSPPEGFAVVGTTGLVELQGADPTTAYQRVRVFAGYAGWSAGQLDGEVRDNAWFVVAAEEGDIYSTQPESLWRDVLKRQRGQLALFADTPLDPHAN